MQSFETDAVTIKKSMTEYHHLNMKQSGLPFILIQQYMGENEYEKSGHLSIFTILKHLMVLLKYKISGLHFYTLSKTLKACRAMQLRFFLKVETLLKPQDSGRFVKIFLDLQKVDHTIRKHH